MKPVKICVAAVTLACLSTQGALAQEGGGTASPPPSAGSGAAPQGQKLPEVQVIQGPQKTPVKPKKTVQKAKTPTPSQAQAAAPAPAAEVVVQGGAAPTANYAIPAPPDDVMLSPLPGSELPIQKIPYSVNTVTSSDIARDHSVITQDVLNNRIPGVVVDDLQGNSFQTGIQYRGFAASPVNGVPQGLAVYQNGVRINESFGDTVNWDFIPTNAIADLTVMSSNPIFGLNAIGGAINLTMKDGFMFQGANVDTRFGSFGRKQVSTEAGMRSGNWAAYGAFEAVNDDGFRDFSGATARRGYADLGVKGDGAEFHFNSTIANGVVGVTAAVPEELLNFGGRTRTFTSPQITNNDMQMYSLNGVVQVAPQTSVSGATYYRRFRQRHIDGNIAEYQPCEGGSVLGTELCSEGGAPLYGVGPNGLTGITNLASYGTLGSIDKTGQDADGFGGSLQATNKSKLFGHRNQFIIGTSYDRGRVAYQASSQLGSFLPKYVVDGTGPTLSGDPSLPPCDDDNTECYASEVTPRTLTTTNDYIGVYFLDSFDVNDRLTVTAGGRFNYARIEIVNTGDPVLNTLNGVNSYSRFNPSAGFTYKVTPSMSLYGDYSEANRAATPAEIACSDPNNPCIIESALASDPPLKQVVSRTWEIGLRGQNISWSGNERFDWSLGWFRTLNSDDIIQIADEQQGRGYFANAGMTQRQGIEAQASYRNERWFLYGSYAFIDATYQSTNVIPSENNPKVTTPCSDFGIGDEGDDEAAMCLEIRPGDRIPGVPQHRFKAGFDFKITPRWTFGADLIAASSQYFFGDEANLDKPLGGYTKVNLHTSYNLTENIQIYGLIDNLFNQQYGIYGTYFNTGLAQTAGPGEGGSGGPDPSLRGLVYDPNNGRTITPAIPFAAYGGLKVRF